MHSFFPLTVAFICLCRQILINLKMLRDMFSSTQLDNPEGFMLDRSTHCCVVCAFSLFMCHQRYNLFTDSHWLGPDINNVSFPRHVLRGCSFFSPSPAEKLQGTAIKVSACTTYWNSFPALCPSLSKKDAGSWWGVFVYCNQSCMCLSKAFFLSPCR